ncbi:hypothetical protein WA026_015309 [Henosepilachna vigintioctopunctata]|uniref:RAWUL domain-containing protein n=1 Tax=Henosepilachna vigintioctopunctata TaxID=420089 RepID=A0AAW1TUR1_9CUCU
MTRPGSTSNIRTKPPTSSRGRETTGEISRRSEGYFEDEWVNVFRFRYRDAATSGLILKDLRTTFEQQRSMGTESKKSDQCDDVQAETLLKRFLQCPGMCRIDVLKKFIRNKYNVNTDLFQIDILYKRVPLPLPDHYTLIDVAYIYTWKRNEPMRFYFRIIDKGNDELPDLTKVFTPVEAPHLLRPQARSTPSKKITRTSSGLDRKKRTPKKITRKASPKLIKNEDCNNCDKDTIESECSGELKLEISVEQSPNRLDEPQSSPKAQIPPCGDNSTRNAAIECEIKKECEENIDQDLISSEIKIEVDSNSQMNDEATKKEQVYTKITLNRANNLEIITKIQKVSGKDGQSLGMNIINQTVKKTKANNLANEVQNSLSSVPEEAESNIGVKQETPEIVVVKQERLPIENEEPVSRKEVKSLESSTVNVVTGLTEKELEQKKFEFLKSIELTSKKVVDNLAKLLQKQQAKAQSSTSHSSTNKGNLLSTSNKPCYSMKPPVPNAAMEIVKTKRAIAPKPGANGVKRKNSSPIKKEEQSKRSKVEPKRTTKIILQQKPGFPTINPLKPSDILQTTSEPNINQSKDLHSLFQNCRLNIPSSLSITLKENGETSRKPLQMPPVQNYIEILKIDDKEGKKTITLQREDPESTKNSLTENKEPLEIPQLSSQISIITPSNSTTTNNSIKSIGLQESKPTSLLPNAGSITATDYSGKIKESKEMSTKNQQQQSFQKIFEESIKKTEVESVTTESTSDILNGSGKRNILEIAQQLYKRTKNQQDTQKSLVNSTESHAPVSGTFVPKIPIPRLNNQRVVKPPKRIQKYESSPNRASPNQQSSSVGLPHQTLANLHSSSLGLNYTVSVSKQSKDPIKQTYRVNGVMSSETGTPRSVNNGETNVKSPKIRNERSGTPSSPLPSEIISIKSSPSSPLNKSLKVPGGQFSPKVPKVPQSQVARIAKLVPKPEPGSLPSKNSSPRNHSKISHSSPNKSRSSNNSPKLAQSAASSSVSSTSTPALTPNELLEKYNIQNLAQLSASINFNATAAPQNYLNTVQGTQMAAVHQAMLLKQLELQNRQKWLNINQGPLLQFEKYLQSLNATKNQILGNMKDN